QDFVGSLPDSVLNLELTENKLHITTDQYQSTINGILADDFPVMPTIKDGVIWKIPAADFKKALAQVVFAASADDARPVLNGVYFHTAGSQAVAAATDSYRLAENKMGKSAKPVNFLVPASAAQDLLRIIGDADKEVTVNHDDQQVLFGVGDVSLV